MKAIDAMEFLDDELICGAEEYTPHKQPIPIWKYGAAAAACVCAAGGAAVLSQNAAAPDVAKPSDSIVLPADSVPESDPVSESVPKERPAVIFNDTSPNDVAIGNFFCIYYDEKMSPKMSRSEMLGYFGAELPQALSTESGEWKEVRSNPDDPYFFLCCAGDVLEQYEFAYENVKNGKTARISFLKRNGSSITQMVESLPGFTEEAQAKLKPSEVCGIETTVTTMEYTDDSGIHERLGAGFKSDKCAVSLSCDDLSREEFTELLENLINYVSGGSGTADKDGISFTETDIDDYLIY